MLRNIYFEGELQNHFTKKMTVNAATYKEVFGCIEANYPQFRKFLLDCHTKDIGFVLHVEEENIQESQLFQPIKEGDITLSIKVKEAIKILDFIQLNFNELFNEIAELRINKDDEFEIILSEEPTIVILGQGDFHNKINILKKFDEALGQRQLTDYRLLDMRYSKQLVAREWI